MPPLCTRNRRSEPQLCIVVADALGRLPPGATCAQRYEIVAATLGGVGIECYLREPRPSNQTWITGGPPFLVISGDDAARSSQSQEINPHTDIVVDLYFRDRWTLGRSTDTYDKLLQRSPAAFVGTVPQLWALLKELAREIKQVFDEHCMELPPWRTCRGMRLAYCSSEADSGAGDTEAGCGPGRELRCCA
eukprot:TRINITY_DN14476_c0_g1_i1.p1 TRINITY_DN14476_c0_g1~~TRINITY_DN14476_c0_g1_i1.p1  ORF type:complete len:191 (+),score=44.02 TRINITY_DN14476_c0_g1_i1:165-737(+)